ncbi:hypothetical protein MAR_021011 [Mya arenaria]|uniref:HMG box domain-containing protein n=1 Tax=Mya arenaria TaxID=6604 RepID=A0ABY7E9M0_MYAAR|nr:hypothetical protein MAR_021011 [Mya arenaria]
MKGKSFNAVHNWKNISKEEKVHFKDKARKFAVERLAQQEKKAFNLSLAKQQQQHQQSWNEQQPRAPGHPPGPRTQPSINPVIEGSESAMTTEGYHGATSQQLFLNENNCGQQLMVEKFLQLMVSGPIHHTIHS